MTMTNGTSRVALTTPLLAIPPTYFVTAHAEQLLEQGLPFEFHAVPLAASVTPGTTAIPVTQAAQLPIPYAARSFLAKFAMPMQTSILKRLQPDLIHQHHGTWCAGAVRAAEALRTPLVTTLHGTDVVHAGRDSPRGLQRVHARQTRFAFEHSRLLLAVSEHQKRLALAAGAPSDRLYVHYQGVDTSFFAPPSLKNSRSRPPRILYIGALIPRKRVDLVIRASRSLSRELPHELVIIGDGPLRQELQAQASGDGHVRFAGSTDREGVREHLRESDAILLLSHGEGAGLVLLEAQACGLAAIVSGGDGKAEMVDDGATGAVLSADPTPDEVARALREWLPDSPSMRAQVSSATRSFVVEERSVEAGALSLADYYDSVLG